MSDIKLQQSHALGLDKARELTRQWVDDATQKLGLSCQVTLGDEQDTVTFERSGVKGTMQVSGSSFDLQVKLGMMMSAFKPMIEAEVTKNLDRMIEKASGSSQA
ncbi:MAG TPA: polyhydroxyalkanoic acid system family protein [Aquabacterium sp.]|nr:polyhydroxyalkanoic acid system family protein [Aquabacterium sp.]